MSQKLTTEEFIKKTREVHGDKYDYSKVEYVNNKTKVCIICKEHGVLLQPPSMHLRGHGCAKCSTERNSEKLMLWTREKCYEEAQKSNTRSDFKKNYPYGYSSARKHGWLDDYTWFNPAREHVSAGYWTYDRCYEEARKCKNLKEFEKKANGARQYASKMGWIKDYKWFEKPFRWTRELCEKEAKQYTTKQDFYLNSKNAYAAAVKYGWLSEFTWLIISKQPNGFWTKEKCETEARKYHSKKEFLQGSPAAHAAAAKNGWIDEFTWLLDKRIDIIKGKIDSVYVYVFEETKTAYVGRTLIRRQKKRDKEHIFNLDNDNVARYAKKLHIPVPPMTILESELTLEEELDREDYWRKWYEEQGYTMLNRLATGIGKGSLGAISHGKWNKKACYKEAKKYNSAHEFEDANGSAYDAARRNGWINDYTWFVKYWEPKWNKDTCFLEAKKYTTRAAFLKGNGSAYRRALREGWIDEYTWLKSRQTKPSGYWNNYDHCFEEAKKHKTRSSFQKNCPSGYSNALKNGWLDDYTWFAEKQKHIYWNERTCYEEAKKYDSITAFARNAVRAYELARKNGWLESYSWLQKLTFEWTYELCKEEAKKYTKRSHFKQGSPGAYTKARINGWLDDYSWFDEKPRNNYWNKDTCYEEARKYQSISDFQKRSPGAYGKPWKNGWIGDYTWMPQKQKWTYEACKVEATKYERRGQFEKGCIGAYTKSRINGWLDEFFPKNQ